MAEYTPNDVLGAVLGKDESENVITEVTTPTVNIDSEEDLGAAFKYSSEAWSSLKDAVEELDGDEETHYTLSKFEEACAELQALVDAANTLNEPAADARYKMFISEKPASVSEITDGDGYQIDFTKDDTEYFCQSFLFAPIDGINHYNIYYIDENNNKCYLSAGSDAISTTTTLGEALDVVIEADGETEDTWHICYYAAADNDDAEDPDTDEVAEDADEEEEAAETEETKLYLGITSDDNVLSAYALETEDVSTGIGFNESTKASISYSFGNKYVTSVLPFAVTEEDLPETIEVYKCIKAEPNTSDASEAAYVLTLNQESSIVGNTPCILHYTGGNGAFVRVFSGYGTYTGTAEGVTAVKEKDEDNLLVGTLVSEGTVPVDKYVLQYQDAHGYAFYHVGESSNVSMTAYRCYLDLGDEASDAKVAFLFPDSDVETAISSIADTDDADNEAIYDLSGRKVSKPQHGIYIKGGKKVYVK